jgi:hypothetical protein
VVTTKCQLLSFFRTYLVFNVDRFMSVPLRNRRNNFGLQLWPLNSISSSQTVIKKKFMIALMVDGSKVTHTHEIQIKKVLAGKVTSSSVFSVPSKPDIGLPWSISLHLFSWQNLYRIHYHHNLLSHQRVHFVICTTVQCPIICIFFSGIGHPDSIYDAKRNSSRT